MTMVKRVANHRWVILRWVAFLPATILLVLAAYWSLYPYQVSDVEVPIEIVNTNKTIALGDKIVMRLRVSKPNDYKPNGTVYITCDDGSLVTLSTLVNNLPVGNYEFINDSYILPPKVAKGATCRFNFRNSYRVNPIRTITKQWYSEDFIVMK
jgi:hypothetical protein